MARESISYGAVVRCDMPGCACRFVTYSEASRARKQAINDGWARVSGKKIQDSEGHILSLKQVDLCPEHKPKPRRMEPSP